MLRQLNEATACLRENVVSDAKSLDAGVIFGTGFAPFRGGPMHYIEKHGKELLLVKIMQFEKAYGARFQPDQGWT
jgi:3-hydroxyacyl-CoA dehydrogenase/enoyl-CoA hydratase/3-hydroxybutyryl-CoA epimerase